MVELNVEHLICFVFIQSINGCITMRSILFAIEQQYWSENTLDLGWLANWKNWSSWIKKQDRSKFFCKIGALPHGATSCPYPTCSLQHCFTCVENSGYHSRHDHEELRQELEVAADQGEPPLAWVTFLAARDRCTITWIANKKTFVEFQLSLSSSSSSSLVPDQYISARWKFSSIPYPVPRKISLVAFIDWFGVSDKRMIQLGHPLPPTSIKPAISARYIFILWHSRNKGKLIS